MSKAKYSSDVIIIGASAAGLMCAIEAGKRGRSVTVLDHANKAGKKILMSGGGKCNFTNLEIQADRYLSSNPHFCKSALSRYTQWDFIALVDRYQVPWHERELGKLFCDNSSKDILDILLAECKQAKVKIELNCNITSLDNIEDRYYLATDKGDYTATACVIASGGLSIPKMCATPFGYQMAEKFGHGIVSTSPGLVPFTLHLSDKERFAELAGVSLSCHVSNERASFRENILFTHRGLSGPAILQISSYWKPGETITVDLLPDIDIATQLNESKQHQPGKKLKSLLSQFLPKRLVIAMFKSPELNRSLQECSYELLRSIAEQLHHWQLLPNGTEGYRTAEVTLGGVNCDELSSKTMESRLVNNLYFVGEVVDVTGWLGGYNFQWAWSSGWCAGQVV